MKALRPIKKSLLLRQIVAGLTAQLELLEKAAQASHAEATHESSKPENKYDTRGLEAAYLAGGQARQARELLEAVKVYSALAPRDFAPEDPIELGAVVTLLAEGTEATYFLGPRNGGLEIQHQGREIMVITPASPLGQNLMGRKPGYSWTVKTGLQTQRFQITGVV